MTGRTSTRASVRRSSGARPPVGRRPLRRPPATWERRLAEWWGPRPAGVPTALFVAAWAVAIAVVGTGLGRLLAAMGTSGLGGLDVDAERWLAARRTPWLNTATHVASSMANTTEVVIVALALAALAGLTWRRWAEPAMLVIAIVGDVAIHVAISSAVDRPRPPVPRLDAAQPTSSFPSGHTMAAVALYGAFAVLASERWHGRAAHLFALVVAVLVPAAVAFSRMYRGMHFPTDVVAGACLGSAWLVVAVHAVRIGAHHAAVRVAGSRG